MRTGSQDGSLSWEGPRCGHAGCSPDRYHAVMGGDSDGAAVQNAGPVPFRLRIGVTGHRDLPEGTNWPERIAEALGLIQERLDPAGGTPLAWSVISSLAEGADRLVAETVLARPGSQLEIPLPLPVGDYQTDFKSEESKAAFGKLCSQASLIIRAPGFESRESAYEWAGLTMVGRSDIVIALWDGQRSRGVGGTAGIVTLARRYGRPVVHIPTGNAQEIRVLHAFEDEPSPFNDKRRAGLRRQRRRPAARTGAAR